MVVSSEPGRPRPPVAGYRGDRGDAPLGIAARVSPADLLVVGGRRARPRSSGSWTSSTKAIRAPSNWRVNRGSARPGSRSSPLALSSRTSFSRERHRARTRVAVLRLPRCVGRLRRRAPSRNGSRRWMTMSKLSSRTSSRPVSVRRRPRGGAPARVAIAARALRRALERLAAPTPRARAG